MTKRKNPRDGWLGRLFRSIREATGRFEGRAPRSTAWLAAQTGVSTRHIDRYERDEIFPPHRWRDAAALALRVNRGLLGREGD